MSKGIGSNIEALYGSLSEFINTKTVVGDPVTIGEITIVPLVDVNFGVASGALSGEKDDKTEKDSGAGGVFAKVMPSAVLVINNGSVQLVSLKNQDSVNKIIDMVPGILSKLNLENMFKKNDDFADNDNVEDDLGEFIE